jgi:hypothetical protein
MKYGHVSSNLSELAVGTGRAARFVARGVSLPLSIVAMVSPSTCISGPNHSLGELAFASDKYVPRIPVTPDTPKMHRDESRENNGERNTMQDIKTQ